ncbi:hypothetical protein PGTUg99_003801 [Puccinia graminis f. sp. tritici]|uniref:Uncharacterized protein n=1 Tax=Puccinia graminis f. sp. tritici TaxID=56615 RepID=A0A5B0RB97_PUCGR|nr:hypothetical protein PGTUg99_003801 [Puccinia graminis f. sp. tritici]
MKNTNQILSTPRLLQPPIPCPTLSRSARLTPMTLRWLPRISLQTPVIFPPRPPSTSSQTSASLSCDETGSLLYRPKDAHGACAAETHCGLKSPSRASRSFWKRLSLSPSLQADPEVAGLATPEMSMSPVEDGNPTNVSSDGHPSSIMSSELSSAPSSANETADTSLASADEAESVEECGLAGIGLRDRRSICLHSLPIRNALGPSPLAGPTNIKPLVHPAMRYAPSSSSPLSSRLAPRLRLQRTIPRPPLISEPGLKDSPPYPTPLPPRPSPLAKQASDELRLS